VRLYVDGNTAVVLLIPGRSAALRKIFELDDLARKIAATKELLERSCNCKDFAECGHRILARKRRTVQDEE